MPTTRPPRGYLCLDLDGTLIDSVPDLADALNRLFAPDGLPPLAEPAVARMVGDGAAMLLRRALAAHGRAAEAGPAFDALLARFVADYTSHSAERTRPFPGVPETLAALRQAGWVLGVVTNKPERATRAVLAALGLAPLFVAVGGGDSYPARKPDPRHLLAVLEAMGGEPAHAAMVGDHHNDIVAARGAGVRVAVAVAYGYAAEPAEALGADAVLARFADLPALLDRLLPVAAGTSGASPARAAAPR